MSDSHHTAAEISASKLLAHHLSHQTERIEYSEKLSKQFVNDVEAIPRAFDEVMQTRARNLHKNRQSIANQADNLKNQTTALTKQTKLWKQLAKDANSKLKQGGDLQNWAELVDRDIRILEETVKIKNSQT
ncbi:hypothetical protein NADFUDRAFT_53369 [Nadsonia fulvescens var. elongata DSM 6958]|uniref:Biogenesis of lysosome-related organelles complex 1 subunit 1 n=1 Tax=Nadsonia fulvescens var. elongata DSM 6958 TaxID=857566 RepID=A0A1E3PES9_9ASCO|nr:hypothetical protein NADFUDRAFT_53369 [Nadsonia fulvescens var. elongata DSM 6958]